MKKLYIPLLFLVPAFLTTSGLKAQQTTDNTPKLGVAEKKDAVNAVEVKTNDNVIAPKLSVGDKLEVIDVQKTKPQSKPKQEDSTPKLDVMDKKEEK
ncbi:MAG: hypothetical protein KDD41_06370 [Flavobacteriales bacterium]|nr:hypothetical protein [Flavobacteriales bacterium]